MYRVRGSRQGEPARQSSFSRAGYKKQVNRDYLEVHRGVGPPLGVAQSPACPLFLIYARHISGVCHFICSASGIVFKNYVR